jgi:general secretion pathway protein J
MKGFTLVEMLVALFIFSLLAAAGVTVMRFSVDNQVAVRSRMDRLGDFQRARALLKGDLEQAAPRRTRDEAGAPAPGAFAGGPLPGVLLALTRRGWDNPDKVARASLQYVEYRVVDGRLERRSRAALDGVQLGEAQQLIDGVEAADVEFLSQGAWRPSWTASASVPTPQVVRLTLKLKSVGEIRQLFLLPGGAS